MAVLQVVLLVLSLRLLVAEATATLPFSVKESSSQLNISFGELVVVLDKSPWRMTVVDSTTGGALLVESSEEDQRMGFGKWDGVYLNKIYEGYLLRIGAIVEWYHAETISGWTNTSDTVTVTVATSDSKGRSLKVDFTGFLQRQFSMHSAVEGSYAEDSNRVAIGFLTPDDEGFYGFGERFTDCNQRGHRVGSWLEDGSWGLGVFDPAAWKLRVPKGEESTYCPMPILLSTRGYALQMDTFYRTVYDLAKETEGIMKLEQETNTLNITFMMTKNPLDAFSKVIEHNGKSLIPPPWEFSPWNQLTSESSASGPERIVQFFFKYDIPCSFDVHGVHFFPEGDQRGQEEKLKADNEALLALGVKSTAYFNAMLGRSYTELYDVAAANGYFIMTADGKPYNYSYIGATTFQVSQMDFSNPAAVKWYQEQLQTAIDLKFSGWMYDYGEYTPPDSVAFDGSIGLKMHNEFSLLYQKTAFDFFQTLDPDPTDDYAPDYVFYVRSSYVGSQRYTWAQWTGDPSSDWSYASGLPAQVVASLNIGLSGMPYSGSDIGGFEWYVDPPPDLELWARWTAAGCVSGLMHEQGGGKGTGPKTHIFDFENGTEIWRKFAKLRTQLFPYIYTQAHIARETGLPIMRHHLLTFWNDSTAIAQCQQYMFGESFLAAPVVKESATKWDVYLPAYKYTPGPYWLDVGSTFQYNTTDGRFRIGYSGYIEGGKTVTVDAPLDTVPLFVMAGSVIPVLDPTVQTLNNATNTSVITWFKKKDLRHVWVFADAQFHAWGRTWDGLEYELGAGQAVGSTALQFTVSGAPKGSIHIPQIVGPWESAGYPTNVTSSEHMESYPTWQELLTGSSGGYTFDKQQQALWIKLLTSDSASISLG